MIYHIQTGIFGLIGVAILLISVSRQPKRNPESRRLFMILVYVSGVLMTTDILQVLLDGVPGIPARIALSAVTFVQYLLNPMIGALWLLYSAQLTSRSMFRPFSLFSLALLPVFVNAVFTVLSLTGNYTFWIDASNHYHRGRFFFVMIACNTFGIAIVLLYTQVYRQRIRRREYLALISCSLLPVFGGFVQVLVPSAHTARIATFFGLLIVYLNFQSRALAEQQQATSQLEIAFLRSQANPHFLFNTLSVISAYCETDPRKAMQLLGDFSRYLRTSFDFDARIDRVALKDELQMMDSYLAVARSLHGERLNVEVDVESGLMLTSTIPLLIQPLVENAVRHGVLAKESGGTVRVHIRRADDDLLVTVSDDGVGMTREQIHKALRLRRSPAEPNERVQVGLSNIALRIRASKGRVEIDSVPGEGTSVTVRLPILEEELE